MTNQIKPKEIYQELYHDQPLLLNPRLATIIGLNEALVLNQLFYWLKKSGHIINGQKWIYNSIQDWLKQFPFFSKNTLIRTFKSLEKQNLLITDNFNKAKFDKTKWYSLNLEFLKQVNIDDQAYTQTEQSVYPNWVNDITNMGITIPEITTEITTEITFKKERAIAPKTLEKNIFENLEQEKLQYLIDKGFDERLAKQQLRLFVDYWTETNRKGKQRWQGQEYFDINKRLITWFSRVVDHNKPKVMVHMQAPRGVAKI